jgi:hypothetical protein
MRAKVATNAESMMQQLHKEYVILNKSNGIIDDMVDQAMLLNCKLNFAWSVQMLRQQHSKWTRDIMRLEGTEGENIVVTYLVM